MFTSVWRCQGRLPLFKPPSLGPTSLARRRSFQTSVLRRLPRTLQQDARSEVESFKYTLKKSKPEEAFTEKIGKPKNRRQILLAVFGSLFAFAYAASSTNIETEYWVRRLKSASTIWLLQPMSSTDLKRIQNTELIRRLRERFAQLNQSVQSMPTVVRNYIGLAFVSVVQPYADASEGKRLCWKICMLNAGVYLAWKVAALQPGMAVRFMHNPLSGLSYTLLTSMFSHKSFIHLLFNCLALESFGSSAYYYLMKAQEKTEPPMLESTAAFHFLAFFVSAGLFSGLVSHLAATKVMYPRIIKHASLATRTSAKPETWSGAVAAASTSMAAAAKEVPSILPSLGASGAVYAMVTTTALAFPNSEVALFIPPSYPINIQYAVTGMVALDTIGILRGWRRFDHWAHLGGAAFGAAYYAYGPEFWAGMRRSLSLPPEYLEYP